MNPHTAFSTKAENYARYRWGYGADVIDDFCRAAGLGAASLVVDLGAGTGLLTRPLAQRVGRVLAIEPNLEMLNEAQRFLTGVHNCRLLAAGAEALPLPDHCADAIVAAEAVHWFDPEPARSEMLRILKPGGWLALFHNAGRDAERGEAMSALRSPELGVAPVAYHQPVTPWEFFFNGAPIEKRVFPFEFPQDWEHFWGALISTSNMPDEGHPLYPKLEQAARQVFDRFSRDGLLDVHGETELMLGQPLLL
jgi:SAM-dependent methyltransferase